jgi:hypothetical protein
MSATHTSPVRIAILVCLAAAAAWLAFGGHGGTAGQPPAGAPGGPAPAAGGG